MVFVPWEVARNGKLYNRSFWLAGGSPRPRARGVQLGRMPYTTRDLWEQRNQCMEGLQLLVDTITTCECELMFLSRFAHKRPVQLRHSTFLGQMYKSIKDGSHDMAPLGGDCHFASPILRVGDVLIRLSQELAAVGKVSVYPSLWTKPQPCALPCRGSTPVSA